MPDGVVQVVFEPVSILEDTFAEVAVVLVIGRLLDVVQ